MPTSTMIASTTVTGGAMAWAMGDSFLEGALRGLEIGALNHAVCEDWVLDDDGHFSKLKGMQGESEKYDRIYSKDLTKYIKIRNTTFVKNLHKSDVATLTSPAFSLFKFLADNSKVEWGYYGMKDGTYRFQTSHISNIVGGPRYCETKWRVHSHPGVDADGTAGASGYSPNGNYTADMGILKYEGNAYYRQHGSMAGFPLTYVYHTPSQTLYEYDFGSPARRSWPLFNY